MRGWRRYLATVLAALLFVAITDQEQQQLFQAVRQHLTAAHLTERDLPKRVIEVRELGGRRYHVRMQMGQGEGWFEVTWVQDHWAVRGLPRQP